ncbi:hypothetical protein [Kitasatospora sp. NPDC087315]|uniref:hypothetical protein n=1 Tax=Kitasatospora sp. NPDC087315 TaxID=3364069 RepID=UPI003816A813
MEDITGEREARELIAGWLAEEPAAGSAADRGEPDDPGVPGAPDGADGLDFPVGGGLAVPSASGYEVARAARVLAVRGLGRTRLPLVPDGLRLVAEALVVDEHPSVATWTPLERAEAVEWVALLVHRFGEDGVQSLLAELVNPSLP